MARNGKFSGGRQFKKGDPRINRKGQPKKPKDLKMAEKELSNSILEAKIRKFLAYNKAELNKIISDPKTPAIDLALCSIITKAITGSDQQRLDWVITRLLGKVKEPEQTVTFRLDQMPRHEVIDLGKEALQFLEKGSDE